ncbi:MAG: hypothetical protein ACRCYU_01220 [Nocardioides sp.]
MDRTNVSVVLRAPLLLVLAGVWYIDSLMIWSGFAEKHEEGYFGLNLVSISGAVFVLAPPVVLLAGYFFRKAISWPAVLVAAMFVVSGTIYAATMVSGGF